VTQRFPGALLGKTPMHDKLTVNVTFDERGYVGTADGLPTIIALSLAGLRRRIEAALMPDEVVIVLQLDRTARLERDRRRNGRPWPTHRAEV
jgi:hypothetical protein